MTNEPITTTEELEYFVPAPVLIQSEKLFNFGLISFSLVEFVELLGVLLVCYLVWNLLGFLPLLVKLVISTIEVVTGFLFITQPVNGLPGDTWLRYSLRHYLFERAKHHLQRRGRAFIQLKGLRLHRAETNLLQLQYHPQGEEPSDAFL